MCISGIMNPDVPLSLNVYVFIKKYHVVISEMVKLGWVRETHGGKDHVPSLLPVSRQQVMRLEVEC